MRMCVCVYVLTQVQAPSEARGIGFPWTEITGDCEPNDLGAGNQTCIFLETRFYSVAQVGLDLMAILP